MERTRVEVPCPGSTGNAVVLVATSWQAVYGISRPKNVGECPLFLNWEDENGKWYEAGVKLLPGQQIHSYRPSSGKAARILVAASKNCYGEGILEYDSPYA